MSAAILGALFSISEKTVRYAMKIIGSKVLREAVQSGKYKVSAVSSLAKLSPAEQRQKLDEWARPKVRTPVATAEKDESPSVPYFEVDLNAPEFEMDLARPNLASDATVVIKADSLQIGAAAALLWKWKVPITDVWCAQGAFKPGAILLIGGPPPEAEDESAFSHTLAAMVTALASPKPMEASASGWLDRLDIQVPNLFIGTDEDRQTYLLEDPRDDVPSGREDPATNPSPAPEPAPESAAAPG